MTALIIIGVFFAIVGLTVLGMYLLTKELDKRLDEGID